MCQANETRLRFCAPDAFSGPLQKGMMMSRELLSSRDVTTHVTPRVSRNHSHFPAVRGKVLLRKRVFPDPPDLLNTSNGAGYAVRLWIFVVYVVG